MKSENHNSTTVILLSWLLGGLFCILGVLNTLLIHPVPGLFYLILSLVYFPPTFGLFKKYAGFSVPFWLRLIVAFAVLWGTLAVGDLAELFGL